MLLGVSQLVSKLGISGRGDSCALGVEVEPALAADVLFGARALLALDGRWAAHLLDAFRTGRSSLLAERPAVTAA